LPKPPKPPAAGAAAPPPPPAVDAIGVDDPPKENVAPGTVVTGAAATG